MRTIANGAPVGLVGGAAAIEIVEVERGRAAVGQCIRVVLPLQAARSIKGDIVINELAEVWVSGGNPEVLYTS
jgi:uncharacterized protein (DUF58 family)